MKIISGGQTGVDRAALDVALELGISCGGCCPKGRKAEDGRIDDRYPLVELDESDYGARTAYNVSEGDVTLLLKPNHLWKSPGTYLTEKICRRQRKVCCVVHLEECDLGYEAGYLRSVFSEHGVNVLNVAGPRESKCPGIYEKARVFLREVLTPGENQ